MTKKEKILKLIERQFKSPYQLCKQAGINNSQLYNAIAGRKFLSVASALKLLRAGADWELVRELVRDEVRELGDFLLKQNQGGQDDGKNS
jgi:hypothetical protein